MHQIKYDTTLKGDVLDNVCPHILFVPMQLRPPALSAFHSEVSVSSIPIMTARLTVCFSYIKSHMYGYFLSSFRAYSYKCIVDCVFK